MSVTNPEYECRHWVASTWLGERVYCYLVTEISRNKTINDAPKKIRLIFYVRFLSVLLLHPYAAYSTRGPHRYTRTVRVPILRPKIPVKKRVISNRYFGTGNMTEKSAETRDRRENTSRIRDRVIRLSRLIYLRWRDRGIGGKILRDRVIRLSCSIYLRSRDRGW